MAQGKRVVRGLVLVGALALLGTSSLASGQTRDIGVGQSTAAYGDSWAVVIGINEYQHPRVPKLQAAVNDARAIEAMLRAQGFRPDRIVKLVDGEATKHRIETVLGDELRQKVGTDDRVLVFFAGHGKTDRLRSGEEEGYLIPVDGDPGRLFGSAISMTALRQISDRLPAKHILYIVDACYSGYAVYNRAIGDDLLDEMMRKPAIQILTAGRQGDQAQERGGHGVFTSVLLRALQGDAFAGKGWMSLEELGIWVKQRVFVESNRKQLPQYGSLYGEGQFVFMRPPRSAGHASGLKIKEEIRQQLGALAISAKHEGIEVFLGDQRIGETKRGRALVVEDLPVGTLPVRARKAGHADWEQQVAIVVDQRVELVIDLAATDLVRAKELYASGNHPAAAALFRVAAADGSPDAMYHVALLHEQGRGVTRDDAEAAQWYRKSADAGHVRAMARVGQVYELGRGGITRDYAESVRWYRRGADGGDGRAMAELGLMHVRGLGGLPKDDVEAARLFRAGVDAGDTRAMAYLGLMYEDGRGGLPRDGAEALRLYRRAADAGDGRAMAYLGRAHANARAGLTRDDNEAVRWLRAGVDAGDSLAMAIFGFMQMNGRGGLARDDALAVQWYRRGTELGGLTAMNNLGAAYEHARGGLAKDEVEAVKWYRQSADGGYGLAMLNLGLMLQDGRGGLTKDDAEAVRWFRNGADAGNGTAMANLGFAYRQGRGVSRDETEAVRWYRKGADLGDPLAMNNLGAAYANALGGLPRDEAEAARWYRKAADAGNPGAMFNLGRAYESGKGIAKDQAEALRWYRAAAAQGFEAAINRLKTLGEKP
jgi:TPR repeat protein